MENDKELREKFSKILGSPLEQRGMSYVSNNKHEVYSWEEIFNEIGKLQERANQPPQVVKEYWPSPTPGGVGSSNVHYHNGMPCYQNPCVWC